jgi:deoxyadenosine/deoxycytidine kinase
MKTNNKIISIEGNIGSGKTTLLKNLREYYKNNDNIIFLDEPLNEWNKITDENGITILEKFYMDQKKYAFSFQMMAYITRLAILRKAYNSNNNKIIITERCLHTDKYVFANMLHKSDNIEDINYKIYLNWFDEFANEFPINQIIYVKTDPNICYQRIHQRNRTGEEIISQNYLDECHKYHELFINEQLNESNKFVINGNMNIYEDDSIVSMWLNDVNNLL